MVWASQDSPRGVAAPGVGPVRDDQRGALRVLRFWQAALVAFLPGAELGPHLPQRAEVVE